MNQFVFPSEIHPEKLTNKESNLYCYFHFISDFDKYSVHLAFYLTFKKISRKLEAAGTLLVGVKLKIKEKSKQTNHNLAIL